MILSGYLMDWIKMKNKKYLLENHRNRGKIVTPNTHIHDPQKTHTYMTPNTHIHDLSVFLA